MKFLVSIALMMLSTVACIGSVCNPDEEIAKTYVPILP